MSLAFITMIFDLCIQCLVFINSLKRLDRYQNAVRKIIHLFQIGQISYVNLFTDSKIMGFICDTGVTFKTITKNCTIRSRLYNRNCQVKFIIKFKTQPYVCTQMSSSFMQREVIYMINKARQFDGNNKHW